MACVCIEAYVHLRNRLGQKLMGMAWMQVAKRKQLVRLFEEQSL
jgi:hypothetical protein